MSRSSTSTALRVATAAALLACPLMAAAADHVETPLTRADLPADIADMYLFRPLDANNRIVAALSFANQSAATGGRVDFSFYCDRNVLYTFNFDRTGDAVPDFQVFARFGRDSAGACGVQLDGVPGASGTLVAPVGSVFSDSSGLRVYAGRNDDPFFFDTIGFNATIASFAPDEVPNGMLGIMNTRDGFAGRNACFIVFEMDQAAAVASSRTLRFWGTTSRFPGTTPVTQP